MEMTQLASSKTLEVQDNIAQAVELRKAGATYEQIGKTLNLSRSRAHQLVQEGLEVIREQIRQDANLVMALELDRLDAMLLSLWKDKKNPRVADTILRIMERKHKLQGLEAPTRIEATGTLNTIEINQYANWNTEDLEILANLNSKYETHQSADIGQLNSSENPLVK